MLYKQYLQYCLFIISLLHSSLSFLLVYYYIFLSLYLSPCFFLCSFFCLYLWKCEYCPSLVRLPYIPISQFIFFFFPFPIFSWSGNNYLISYLSPKKKEVKKKGDGVRCVFAPSAVVSVQFQGPPPPPPPTCSPLQDFSHFWWPRPKSRTASIWELGSVAAEFGQQSWSCTSFRCSDRTLRSRDRFLNFPQEIVKI